MKTKTSKKSQINSKINGKPVDKGMHSSQLMELFEDQLKDILWAEKALLKAIPKMISMVDSDYLIVALTKHLEETKKHIDRLAVVFRMIDKNTSTVKQAE